MIEKRTWWMRTQEHGIYHAFSMSLDGIVTGKAYCGVDRPEGDLKGVYRPERRLCCEKCVRNLGNAQKLFDALLRQAFENAARGKEERDEQA